MTETPSSDLFLRVIAIFKLVKAVLFVCAGLALLHDMNKDVQKQLEHVMGNLHVDTEHHIARWCLEKAGELTRTKLASFSAICFFYATLFSIEGTGLYLRKRWAEWLVVVLTASLLPYEAYLIWHKISWLKILLTCINLTILAYLITVIRRKQDK
jgi:uncharacterized membrane protein (DUF2068 family)